MSDTEIQMDDYTVTSQSADVEQVRASLADPAAVPAETPAETPEAPVAPEVPEAPAAAAAETPTGEGQPRDAKGQFAHKRKASLQERLDHTVWEREEARRESARLSAELEALRRSAAPPSSAPSGPPPSPAAPAPDDDLEPDIADFDDHKDFVNATVAWHLRQRDKAAAAWAAQQEQVALGRAYQEREKVFAATEPTYREAMSRVAKVEIPPVLQHAILASEHGPALAFYLAQHPEYATGLIEKHWKTPIEAAPLLRELLESKLPSSPAPTGSGNGNRVVVPPPISPVGASPVVADPTPIDELPPDEYVEAMNARERAERLKHSTLRR